MKTATEGNETVYEPVTVFVVSCFDLKVAPNCLFSSGLINEFKITYNDNDN